MKKTLWIASNAIAVFSGLWLLQAQAPSSNFTGTVTPLTEGKEGSIAHFRFEPGSRSKWHSHSKGQIILVEEGIGLVQERGGPIIELHAGETIFAKPGVTHWHGAAPKAGGVQYNVTRGDIVWMEEVNEKDYNGHTKRLHQ
jgi:quercetin dioxygenase-like cupin family protein